MNDEQLEKISEFMQAKCFGRFSQVLECDKRDEVVFDNVRSFRLGGENFAVGVWSAKKEIEPHTEWIQFGDPHMTVHRVAYTTPFEKAQSVMCIAKLDDEGRPIKDPRWIFAEAKTAHECETGRGENTIVEKKEDKTSVYFPDLSTAHDYNYSFYLDRFIDLTDRDTFCAMVVRHALRVSDAKKIAESGKEKEKAQEYTRLKKKLSFYAAACQTEMSDEGKTQLKKVERFRKLRRAVEQKRVTLAQKVGARMAKTAKIISANVKGK